MECPQCGFRQPDSNECMQCQAPMGDMADQLSGFSDESEGNLPERTPSPTATAVAPPPLEMPPPAPPQPAAPPPQDPFPPPEDAFPPQQTAPPMPKPAVPAAPTPKPGDLPPPAAPPAGTGVVSKPPAPPAPPPPQPPPAAPASPPSAPPSPAGAPSVVLVTTSDVPGKQIKSVQGMVSAHALVRVTPEVTAQLKANPAMPLSGAAMDQGTRTAEIGLIGAAVAKGSNAVVGITSDWKPAADGALLLTMSGTAVTVA